MLLVDKSWGLAPGARAELVGADPTLFGRLPVSVAVPLLMGTTSRADQPNALEASPTLKVLWATFTEIEVSGDEVYVEME